MAKVIRKTMFQIQEKEELSKEIETVIAAKKMEFLVMAVIPFGMIAYMLVSFPEFYGGALSGDSGQSGDDRMSPFVFGSFLEWVSNDKD